MTIGIIDNNKYLRTSGKFHSLEQRSLAHLVDDSLAAAGWLILFNIIVIIWEIPHAVAPCLSVQHRFFQRYTVVLQIIVSSLSIWESKLIAR